jgi:predicted PurR-regulated permease PerM
MTEGTPPWVRAVFAFLCLLAVLYGLSLILSGLTPFLAAFAIAYFLNPSLNRFEKRIAPLLAALPVLGKRLDARGVSVLMTLSSVATIAVVIVLLAIPALVLQVEDAARALPRMVENVKTRVEPLLERVNLRYPDESSQVRAVIEEKLKEKLPELLAPVTHFLRFALESSFTFVSLFIHLFVVPVFAGYLLYDMNRIRAGVVDYIPPRIRPWLVEQLRQVDRLLAAFVRGQVTVCFILALFYGVALSILGVPLGLVLGFVIGFFNLVPFMAFVAGLPLALVIAWAGDCGTNTLFWIVVVFFTGKFGDIYMLSPKIVGDSLGLHSVVVILALLLGGEYFGFAGLLLAVPATAAASVFWDDIVAAYKRSGFYGAEPSEPPSIELAAIPADERNLPSGN